MMRALLLVLCLVLAAGCAPHGEGAMTLIYGSPYSPGHPFSRADKTWMEFVEAESGGALRIAPNWSGGLVSSDESMLEVRHGVVDIALITPIYARGGAHLVRTQAGFYGGVRTYADQISVYRCLTHEFPQFETEMRGLKILAVQGGNLPGVLTRNRPVRHLEDFKGLRLRAPSELMGLLKQLGADPVVIPMGEVYSALAKGVIDGVVAPEDTLQTLHFAEVANHYSLARFSRGAYPARAMSQAAFDMLGDDLKSVIERSIPVWEQALEIEVTRAQAAGAEFGRKAGANFVDFPPAEQQRLDLMYNEQALAAARRLDLGEGTAEPVFRRAQLVREALLAGAPPTCAAPGRRP